MRLNSFKSWAILRLTWKNALLVKKSVYINNSSDFAFLDRQSLAQILLLRLDLKGFAWWCKYRLTFFHDCTYKSSCKICNARLKWYHSWVNTYYIIYIHARSDKLWKSYLIFITIDWSCSWIRHNSYRIYENRSRVGYVYILNEKKVVN